MCLRAESSVFWLHEEAAPLLQVPTSGLMAPGDFLVLLRLSEQIRREIEHIYKTRERERERGRETLTGWYRGGEREEGSLQQTAHVHTAYAGVQEGGVGRPTPTPAPMVR
jgi:hypothetical protein